MTTGDIGFLADISRRMLPIGRERRLRVVDAVQLGPGNRLAVVAFGDRELLLSISKGNVQLIAEQAG